MICATVATATIGAVRPVRGEQARDARWRRFVAALVDIIIFGVLSSIINGLFGVSQVTSGSIVPNDGGSRMFSFETQVAWPWLALAASVYFAAPEALFGGSFGKLLLRLRVVRVDAQTLGLGEVIVRNVMRLVDGLPAFNIVGGVAVLITRNSQRVGDLLAGTTVVGLEHALDPGATRRAGNHARRIAGLCVGALALLALVFGYFGRPPLVIEGLFNTGSLTAATATSYSLGQAQWGLGVVTYSLTTSGPTSAADCSGTITLHWEVFGWTEDSAAYSCKG